MLEDALKAQDESLRRTLEEVIERESNKQTEILTAADLYLEDLTVLTTDKEKAELVTNEILKFREQQMLEKSKMKEKQSQEKEDEKKKRQVESEIRRLSDFRLREMNRETKRLNSLRSDLVEKEKSFEKFERIRDQDPNYEFDSRLQQRFADRLKDIDREISSEDFLMRRIDDDRRRRDRKREREDDQYEADLLLRRSLSSSSSSSASSSSPKRTSKSSSDRSNENSLMSSPLSPSSYYTF